MTIENGVVQNKKVALVTGGSRGLGKDIALSLARMGVGIVLTYHSNKTEGERVAEEIQASGGKAIALSLDVSITASFDTFFDSLRVVLPEKFGTEKIDFLINNAGFGKAIPIEKLTEPDFDRFVDVHFKGVVFLTQKALAIMNDGGGVVFITAAADRYNVPGYASYAACKGAVEVFTRYVAKEYGPRGIRANAVAPGGIVTDFNNAAIRNNPKAQEWIVAQTPMGRLGQAHDIGGLVALLCADDARWLTGQRLDRCLVKPSGIGIVIGSSRSAVERGACSFDIASPGERPHRQGGHRDKHISAEFCELVVHPRRDARCHLARNVSIPLQPPERSCENLLRNGANASLQLAKPHTSLGQHIDDEDGPLVADARKHIAD